MGHSGNDWDDDYYDEDPSGGGIFTRTLRNVGFVVVVCTVLLILFDSGSDTTAPSANALVGPSGETGQPVRQASAPGTEVMLRADSSGHFLVDAKVNGTMIRFLVDTGASAVALSPSDARRLGYDLDRLSYSKRYRTANGTIRAAPVRLRSIRIGDIEVNDVNASVNGAPMDISLLGMSFLGRLESYEVRGDKLVMAW